MFCSGLSEVPLFSKEFKKINFGAKVWPENKDVSKSKTKKINDDGNFGFLPKKFNFFLERNLNVNVLWAGLLSNQVK
jgi:hypothetical protein